MTTAKYLKSQNAWKLNIFICINIAVFAAIILGFKIDLSLLDILWQRLNIKNGIIAAGVPLVAVILNGILNHEWKARLVFWRYTNPLPGCRAFSKLIHADPRIDINNLKKRIGSFPKKPSEQNYLWFGLYKKHQSDITVVEAHKVYLLTRDLAAISFLFLLSFSIGLLIAHVTSNIALPYLVALLLQYIIIALSARNYGIRFVLNVLTEGSHVR